MKALISSIENSLEKIENGSIALSELEQLVDSSRELYERLVVIRYNVYKNQVLGTSNTVVEEPIATPAPIEEILVQESPIVENQESEETSFEFSLFDEAPEEIVMEETIVEAPVFETPVEEESFHIEETSEVAIENEIVVEEIPVFVAPEPVYEQAPIEDEKPFVAASVPPSNFDEVSIPTPVFASAPIDVTPVTPHVPEVPVSFSTSEPTPAPVVETAPIVESEPVYTNATFTQSHPMEASIKVVEDTVRMKYSIVPLETLIGSFSLNEKLQLINELYGGSSDVFSSAIKRLDAQANLSATRPILAEMAEMHNWDLESETTEEFIFKICRRYAGALAV